MSSGKKPGFPFVKVPHDRHPALWSVSCFARGLALELFIASCTGGERGYDSVPIPVHGDWKVSLCRLLQVDSVERGNVCRILLRLQAVGVLVVEGNFVHVNYSAPTYPGPGPEKVRPDSETTPPTVHQQSVTGPVDVRTDLTPGNDTNHVNQIDREIEEKERETRAREGQEPEPQSPPWVALGSHYADLHDAEQEGARDARQYDRGRITSADARAFQSLLTEVRKESARTALSPETVFEAAATAFLRDPRQRAKGYVLRYLASDFTRYCDAAGIRVAV